MAMYFPISILMYKIFLDKVTSKSLCNYNTMQPWQLKVFMNMFDFICIFCTCLSLYIFMNKFLHAGFAVSF